MQWDLIRKDRLVEAKRSLKRLNSDSSEEHMAGRLAMLVHTIHIQTQIEKPRHGATYFDFDFFMGVELRRAEIACVAFAGQILAGSTFAYQPNYPFANAVIRADDA